MVESISGPGGFWIAMLLTSLAGLSTTLGSAIGVFYKEPGPRYMAFSLGFSAGVMVFVSFVELLGAGIDEVGFDSALVVFFIGISAMFFIDYFSPHFYILETPHREGGDKLARATLLVAFGIGIHNFPEGMATFVATLSDTELGIAMAIAIAIHNIPEGIAVAVPVYAATKSASRAFKWSFLSGVSEPVGALVAAFVLMPILSATVVAWMLCLVAGFMVFISLDELLPVANSYGREHVSIMGVILGMAVMALSLAMLT